MRVTPLATRDVENALAGGKTEDVDQARDIGAVTRR
jgi:hypothetical protein